MVLAEDNIREEIEFRLSLLHLLTVPHQQASTSSTESQALEQLAIMAD